MGNSTSSPKDVRGPALTRTDTGNSAKSSRSVRSRKSIQREDTASISSKFKTPKSLSRKNSFASAVEGGDVIPTLPGGSINYTSNVNSGVNLPPSMMQVAPKEPILIRRNTNTTIDNDIPPISPKYQATIGSPRLNPTKYNGDSEGPSISRTSTNHSSSNLSTNSHGYSGTPLSQINLSPSYINDIQHSNSQLSENSQGDTHSSSSKTLNGNLSRIGTAGSGDNSPFIGTPSSEMSPSPLKKKSTIDLSSSVLSSNNSNSIDIEDLIQRLLDAGYSGKRTKNICLKVSEIQVICAKAREIFLLQPSLLELSPPVKVVGDVHGQYGDLIRIFTKCGFPPLTNYLFLGDYVDRGKQSLETILLLLCYKIKYPENFFLLRGNHECANVTRVYGFYDECKRRCNIKTWKLFIDTFNTLPIAAIVAGKIFCVHGGLSPVLNSMDEIRNIARPTDVPDFGLLNDLVWSDPADTVNEWEDNERGVSYVFSKVAIDKFLQKFGFDLVCRAHMVVEDGYEFFNDRTLVTVFSAPNYCGEFDNWGAVMSVSEDLLCLFELLDPLDSVALKQVMKKGKQERKSAQFQQQQRIS